MSTETTQALEQLFDAGSKEGQLLAYRKCLEIVKLELVCGEANDAALETERRIQEQISLLEAGK